MSKNDDQFNLYFIVVYMLTKVTCKLYICKIELMISYVFVDVLFSLQ